MKQPVSYNFSMEKKYDLEKNEGLNFTSGI